MNDKIVIIGAGPTGLGAAYRLKELGYENFKVFDRNKYVGGLATSFTDDFGFTYDIGGHVMFSHYHYFDKLVDKLLGDEFTEIIREAWIWMMGKFVPYPFQNNIGLLPKEEAVECLMGLIEASKNPLAVSRASNFYDLINAQFGAGIAKYFMLPYNFKVWAHPTEMMSRDWLGERVAIPNLERVVRNALSGTEDKGWGPNNKFKYPLRGGTGGLFAPFVRLVGEDKILLGYEVEKVTSKEVVFTNGRREKYDILISTMPLDLLVEKFSGSTLRMKDAARHLHHSSSYIVGVALEREIETDKCWVYFPEEQTPFYRMTYLHNYSPHIAPPGNSLLLTETSYSKYKQEDKSTIKKRTVDGLLNAGIIDEDDISRILTVKLIDVDYSYPVPTLDRNQALAEIEPALEKQWIFSRGRFGGWRYEIGNMDHSVMQGVEIVNRLLNGEEEKTWRPV